MSSIQRQTLSDGVYEFENKQNADAQALLTIDGGVAFVSATSSSDLFIDYPGGKINTSTKGQYSFVLKTLDLTFNMENKNNAAGMISSGGDDLSVNGDATNSVMQVQITSGTQVISLKLDKASPGILVEQVNFNKGGNLRLNTALKKGQKIQVKLEKGGKGEFVMETE